MKSMNPSLKASKPAKKVGIKHIASEAGCSASTVSRILNNYSEFKVSKDVRDKVMAVAQKYNYSPHPILRTIRAQKTWMVSLLDYGASSHEALSMMRKAIVPVLQKSGYQVGCNFMPDDSDQGREYFPDWNVDGVAFADAYDVNRLGRLDKSGIPYVSMNGVCGPNGAAVLPDEADGMRQAFQHLYDQGHREIAYLIHDRFASPPASTHISVDLRESAYVACMKDAGLSPLVAHGAQGTLARFLQEAVGQNKATAIICYNIYTGVAALHEAWRQGISVPKDLSVMCFDNVYPSEHTIPAMTCVSHHIREIGETAGEMLLKMMADSETMRGHTVRLKPHLTVRESTAPVA
ncbi:MAG: LacI family DNA-binding transcriptional regulator [Planctomycetes bacterium]|nr:LacI family DNA-binding transcriptional regulator [Planctomycetota bacterium]